MQRKVCGQLLLAGQNRTVILFPAVEGECTVHAVLRARHTGRNVCDGVAAALNQRLLCRSGIACRQVAGNIIRQRVHQRMRCLERQNTLQVLALRVRNHIGITISRMRVPACSSFAHLIAVNIPVVNSITAIQFPAVSSFA